LKERNGLSNFPTVSQKTVKTLFNTTIKIRLGYSDKIVAVSLNIVTVSKVKPYKIPAPDNKE